MIKRFREKQSKTVDLSDAESLLNKLPKDLIEKYEIEVRVSPKGITKYIGWDSSKLEIIFTEKSNSEYLIIARCRTGENVSLESKNLEEGIEEVIKKFGIEHGFNYEIENLPDNYFLFPVYDEYPLKKFMGKGPNNTFIDIKEIPGIEMFSVKIQPFESKTIYHVEILEGRKLLETIFSAMQNYLHNSPSFDNQNETGGVKLRFL